MNSKRIAYVVFIFILCTIFSVEVKAAPTNQLGREDAKEISCAYYDDKEAYKLVQDKGGTLYLFESATTRVEDVVVNDVVSWSGQWIESSKKLKLFGGFDASKYVKPGTMLSKELPDKFEDCPGAIITGKDNVLLAYTYEETQGEVIKNNTILELKDKVGKTSIENSSKLENDSSNKLNKTCDEILVDDMWVNNETKGNTLANCLYSYDLKDNKGCMVLQLDIAENGAVSPFVGLPELNVLGTYGSTESFNDYYIRNKYNGYCPNVYVNIEKRPGDFVYSLAFEIDDNKTWFPMNYRDSVGSNLNNSALDISDYNYEGYNLSFIDMTGSEFSCSDLLDEDGDLVSLLHMLLVMVKIIVPIIIIVLGSLDFGTAIFAGDESNMKKAQAKFIKRLVIGVAIFLVPSILKLLLTIGNSVWPIIDADLCGIL